MIIFMIYRFKMSKKYKENLLKEYGNMFIKYIYYIYIIGRIPYKFIFSLNIKNNFI